MARTVVGLFDSAENAQNAVQDLINMGVSRDDISLVARDVHGEYATYSGEMAERGAVEGATAGAIGGGVLGGLLGLLIGVGVLAIPGIGPVVLGGPLAAAIGSAAASTVMGAGVGAISGGLLGALVGAGVPEEQAGYYVEGVRRGGILVSATVDETMADLVYTTMQRHGAVNMEERVAEWRAAGWEGPESSSLEQERERGGETTERPSPMGAAPEREPPLREPGESAGESWEESSKAGTATGAVAGAAGGAAIGSAGGPAGAVVGGIAGAAIGAGLGAAGDIAAERSDEAPAEEEDEGEEPRERERGNV
ncbi:MAG: hypothetical protein KatS3mg057_2458 [Herpetosiphonaceae bacterium]|nr:MAG: hypothetical protein KatS3mg057_2458 [Herpetosiphonaceae bacterium]